MSQLNTVRSDIQQVELTAQQFCVARRIPREQIQVLARHDFNMDALILQLNRTVWSRELNELTLRFPADWWEGLKERFAPRWFLKRHPVRRYAVDLTAYHAYPELVFPRGGQAILHVQKFEHLEEDDG